MRVAVVVEVVVVWMMVVVWMVVLGVVVVADSARRRQEATTRRRWGVGRRVQEGAERRLATRWVARSGAAAAVGVGRPGAGSSGGGCYSQREGLKGDVRGKSIRDPQCSKRHLLLLTPPVLVPALAKHTHRLQGAVQGQEIQGTRREVVAITVWYYHLTYTTLVSVLVVLGNGT